MKYVFSAEFVIKNVGANQAGGAIVSTSYGAPSLGGLGPPSLGRGDFGAPIHRGETPGAQRAPATPRQRDAHTPPTGSPPTPLGRPTDHIPTRTMPAHPTPPHRPTEHIHGPHGGAYTHGQGGGDTTGGRGSNPTPEPLRPQARLGGFNVRGVKNLNPGNIGYGPWARAHGSTGAAGRDTGHGVAVFPSAEAGARALDDLSRAKYCGGRRTANQLIAAPGGWTPGNRAAAANVARGMGLSPGEDLRLNEPAHLAAFPKGLMQQELGPGGAAHFQKLLGKRASAATPSVGGGVTPASSASVQTPTEKP